MASKEEPFKIYFQDSIRRVTLDSTKYEDVVEQLNKLYNSDGLFHPELKIQYMDEEGDKVTVSSQVEWEEMFISVGTTRPIKLYVAEGVMKGKYFKDGPPPQPTYFYSKEEDKIEPPKPDEKRLEELQIAVPRCLARLFPNGKILPYNLPQWLKEADCCTPKALPGSLEIVDLDIDIFRLVSALNKRAIEMMDQEKFDVAKSCLLSLLDLSPSHGIGLYNLACVESLKGNVQESLKILKKAITEGGYTDLAHILEDKDLNNIKTNVSFPQIVELLTQKSGEDTDAARKAEEEAARKAEEAARKAEEEAARKAAEEAARKAEEEARKKAEAEKKVEAEKKRKAKEEAKKKAAAQAKLLKGYRYATKLKQMMAMGFDGNVSKMLLDNFNGDLDRAITACAEMS